MSLYTRSLTLTEELEKLEQSITLTLQGTHADANQLVSSNTTTNLKSSTVYRN